MSYSKMKPFPAGHVGLSIEEFERIKRAAFRAGAEARSKQVIALIEDVNSSDIGTIDFILGHLRTLPMPEMKP